MNNTKFFSEENRKTLTDISEYCDRQIQILEQQNKKLLIRWSIGYFLLGLTIGLVVVVMVIK